MYSDLDTMLTMLRIANSPATFSPTRTLFADSMVAATLLVNAIDRIGERIDDVLHPDYRRQATGSPIFIVAAPRSGTTFLHRLMSLDEQFTTIKLIESFFPTVTGHRVIDAMSRVNGRVGGAIRWLRERADNKYFGAWEGLHDTGLNQDEEDEAIWALAFATPAIWLVLPFPERFAHLRFVDKMPADKRAALIDHYRGCVQRHLFANPGKTLLGKNVLLPGRFETVQAALPNARFIHILRHPYEAIPSTLSLFTILWRWHSPEVPLDGPEAHALAKLMIDYYRDLHVRSLASEAAGEQTFYNVTYRDLLADPVGHIERVYDRFGLTMTDPLRARLVSEVHVRRAFKSEHQYSLAQFGLTREYVYRELADVFERYGFER